MYKILILFLLSIRALFGYEGQTNELKLVSSGEGGVQELCEDLNSGKIMYAYVRIEDPKTGLKKFLLINWQVGNDFTAKNFFYISNTAYHKTNKKKDKNLK